MIIKLTTKYKIIKKITQFQFFDEYFDLQKFIKKFQKKKNLSFNLLHNKGFKASKLSFDTGCNLTNEII